MPRPPEPVDAAAFEAARPRLLRIGYRMLGGWAQAEDVVQDAWVRWQDADRGEVRTPEAFLVRTVTRLCLDQLKSARARHETYVGPWLPDPVIEAPEDRADELTLGLMMALERLSPLERAAFLLHDVFDVGFDEVAAAIGREPAACRQLATRARQHVRAARPRYPVDPVRGQALAAAFFAASRGGDVAALRGMLAADAVAYTDGGGRASAALRPILGGDRIARFLAGLATKFAGSESVLLRTCLIDGLPGFVTREHGGVSQTTALDIDGDRITAIYVTRNPDKLAHLGLDRAPASG